MDGEPHAYEIIAGCHRNEALKRLGHASAPCIVVTDDDLHAELAMIDENLVRTGLSTIQRDRAIARRKEIYLALHPETKAGTAGAKARHGAANDTVSFAKNTAEATGVSERTVERMAERGEASLATISDDEAKAASGTSLDTPSEHKALTALPAKARKPVIEAAKRGEKVSAKAALAGSKLIKKTPPAPVKAGKKPASDTTDYKAGDKSYVLAEWIAQKAKSADEIGELRRWLKASDLSRIESELAELENVLRADLDHDGTTPAAKTPTMPATIGTQEELAL